MIKRVSAVLAIAVGTIALADDAGACYRWKIWRYPFKQTCATAAAVMRPVAPAAIKIPGPAIQDLAPGATTQPFVIPPAAATEADERAWAVNELRKQLSARGM